MTRSLVLTQAEEGQDGQNNDDQADEINQSMHAPLLNQWPEHKTAPKEESSGTAELGIVRRRTRPTSTVAPESAPDTIAKSAAPAHGDGQTGQEQNRPGAGRARSAAAQPRCLPGAGRSRRTRALLGAAANDASARCRSQMPGNAAVQSAPIAQKPAGPKRA